MTRLLATAAFVAGLIALAGCNTVKGVGKDVEATGEAIQGD
jgi:predicted small secreted protein